MKSAAFWCAFIPSVAPFDKAAIMQIEPADRCGLAGMSDCSCQAASRETVRAVEQPSRRGCGRDDQPLPEIHTVAEA